MTKVLRRILLCLVFLVAALPISAFSQDRCNKDRLILTASVSPLKNLNILKIVKGESKKDFKVKKDLKKVKLLLLDTEIERKNKYNFEPFNKRTDSCERIKLSQRKKRIQKSKREIVRNVQCSCDMEVKLHDTLPNDSYMHLLYGLDDGFGMYMPAAWDIFTGNSGVVVGVIDTGIDYNHPDLAQNIWTNPYETPANGIDDDSNGYIDDVHGYDFSNNDSDPIDTLPGGGHGTHVAGTIGAVGNNAAGVVGVNWNVSLMALKTFPTGGGSGSYSDSVEALNYAAMMYDSGVNIVATNNSYGGGTVASVGPIMASSLSAQQSRGIIYVASAGNSALNIDSGNSANLYAPAAINNDIILSVAATTSSGALASYSNYGAVSVDVAAPGSSIASTYPNNQYVYMSGTSMAAPHITGLVALLAGHDSNLSWSQIKDRIMTTGIYNINLAGKVLHPQIANGSNLLQNIVPPTPTVTITPTSTNTFTPSNTATATRTRTPTPTRTNTLTPSSTPVVTNSPVPTVVPTIAPTFAPTRLPIVRERFLMQGKVFFNAGLRKSRTPKLKAIAAKVSIIGSNRKVVKAVPISSSGNWRAELKPGTYTVRVIQGNSNYKVSPSSTIISLSDDADMINFTISKR